MTPNPEAPPTPPAEHDTRPPIEPAPTQGGGALVLLAACSAGAGLIHAAMTPTHVAEWATEGRAFGVLAVAQLLVAAAVLVRPSRSSVALAGAVQVPAVVGWVWSRTAGLPFGPGAGEPQAVGWIDAVATGLEVVALVLAVRLVLADRSAVTRPSGSAAPRRAPRVATAFAVGIVAVAGALAASPVGQHQHGSGHDDGHADDHTDAADHAHADAGIPERPLSPSIRRALASELTTAREVAMRLPTVADAEAAGYTRAGPFAPGAGAHYVNRTYGQAQAFDLDTPLAYLYAGTDPTSPVVGIMYFTLTDTPPEGFTGPLDVWHEHSGVCLTTAPDGSLDVPLPPDAEVTEEACDGFDGDFLDITGQMVHAWVVPGWDSPQGVFSHDNPLVTCADGRTDLGADLYKGCPGIDA